ncbi:Mitochondrial import inner membrane translocase subunit Tim21 [Coemansia spiralis]|uniref:Mitochondrial import inner membrane translocase subunit Tim21 n=2 Tax=Coemansia TaxID=4863 RepID=A0A9W8L0E6_9FUNG|nr:TIM21-domain-containing protein [Coemansia spiralis]KAJ1996061.1 Mitochondrial import inner membrane translocase subunit Tim21 [Coemansia umbellata]KAJ2625503.1 Mitochondrial import inner membrane translocase subunit Tim21 [Coemansia sp. RSA 1358]KAJ2680629.1 Mitochondrial import inner membrane translocase subunit Tim21 [Coemansia spiralis]
MNRALLGINRLLVNRIVAKPDLLHKTSIHYCMRLQPKRTKQQQHTRRLYSTDGQSGGIRRVAGTAGNVLLIGSVMTLFGYIMYTLYDNLIAEHGPTRVYNESLDLIRANPEIRQLFGGSVIGFGEPTHSQRQRQRSIAHKLFEDEQGQQRLTMQYYIRDSKKAIPRLGIVKLDLTQSKGTSAWDYNYIIVDVYSIDSAGDYGQETREFVGRVEVLVTDEFAKQVREFQKKRRNERFTRAGKGSTDGSWFSVLNPTNWRK